MLAVFGNDDPRAEEESLAELERRWLLEHAHGRRIALGPHPVYGYACVPPTPFALKDWERYDVSRFVDPGCVSPEEGYRSVAVPEGETKWGTIAGDLEALVGAADVSSAVFLFHSPPHGTALDRAALDGQSVDHVPLDVHVGSIAIRRFIEARQPRLTLHGHVHESARLTGSWQDRIGRTRLPLRRPRRPRAGPGPLRPGPAGGGHPGAAVGPVIPRELRLGALSFRGA